MSTRCQIVFKDKWGDEFLTYRHCDGYFTNTLHDLVDFILWQGNSIRTDSSYTVANWFYYVKRSYEDYIEKSYKRNSELEKIPYETINWYDFYNTDKNNSNQNNYALPYLLLSYGIDKPKNIHGDIEYFYIVNMSVNGITINGMKLDYGKNYTYEKLMNNEHYVTITINLEEQTIVLDKSGFKKFKSSDISTEKEINDFVMSLMDICNNRIGWDVKIKKSIKRENIKGGVLA